jgi:predicted glycosyltransferase involved in capsule biosynthesis
MKASLLITFYNNFSELDLILQRAMLLSFDIEIIIADDGSKIKSNEIFAKYRKIGLKIKHIWQPDRDFRASKIRNLAALCSNHEYLIFIDADCIPDENFFAVHTKLAKKGFFLSGSRVLLSNKLKTYFYNNPDFKINFLNCFFFFLFGHTNKMLYKLPFNMSLINPFRKKNWEKVQTCNLSLYKSDFINIGGFDENYIGWGLEDSDLIVRLINSGVYKKKIIRGAVVFHLWHEKYSREHLSSNKDKLKYAMQKKIKFSKKSVFKKN